jgi:hypothetical protein
LGLINQALIIIRMHDIPVCAALLKDQHRIFSIVHETGAAIDPMTEVIEQVA